MSNNPANEEQSVLITQTPSQLSPGLAKPEDFKITYAETGDGQSSSALIAEREIEHPHQPTPDRNYVPKQ